MPQPDSARDVIVHHVHGQTGTADRWVIYLGSAKRGEMDNSRGAFVFARLLADLQQRPVWVRHEPGGRLEPLDPGSLSGCGCC